MITALKTEKIPVSFTLALIGRPNVGKSTLFNRLIGKKLALVHDQPGVTRDLREGTARLAELRFTVMDTAGLEEAEDGSLQDRMRKLTEHAIGLADVCLFIVDARTGITPQDQVFANMLHRRGARVLLAANKCEGNAADAGYYEAFSLGLGEPMALSAEHGEGMGELYEALRPIHDAYTEAAQQAEQWAEDIAPDTSVDLTEEEQAQDAPRAVDISKPLQIAVVGRPNAGKSTLVNQILGKEIMLTGPEAGVTRDAIAHRTEWGGRTIRIFDTAGMRRKAKVQETLEKMSVSDGLRAVKFAEVVVILLDAQAPFEQQDLRLADLAAREGRAVLIAVNKWDLIDDKQAKLAELREQFERLLPQLRGAPMITISAETGRGMNRLREAIFKIYEIWNIRISTGRLNRWLGDTVARHAPPAPSGRRIRLRYMTQAKTRPPTFILFVSRPEDLPESYLRYLVNGLRDDFGLMGSPIRMQMRKGENPYEGKKRRQ